MDRRTEPGNDIQPLLDLISDLMREAGIRGREPDPDATLDDDLGLDSLTRMELVGRVESRYGIRIPEDELAELDTPAKLWQAVGAAVPGEPTGPRLERQPPETAASAAPQSATTLNEVLRWHVRQHADRRCITFHEDEGDGEALSYGELLDVAEQVAAGLHAVGVAPGDRVALMLPTHPDYFHGFFGALLAGAVPVPIYPPARPSQLEDHLERQCGILENAGARVLITVREARTVARVLKARLPGLSRVITVDDLRGRGGRLQPIEPRPEDTAFIQYTSGSTGQPKGVVLSHANLLSNIRLAARATAADSNDVFVSWLPLYHDMGLIGAWFGTMTLAIPLVIMSPLRFLVQPKRWLWAMHRHGGTLSAAPNFAYELCLSRIEDAELEGLDLSRWRLCFNGAEAISPVSMERFCERFARFGFRETAMYPVYGLAENSLALAFPPPGRPPRIDTIRRDELAADGRAEEISEDGPGVQRFVSCGFALPEHEIRIVDSAGVDVAEREQGVIQFRGPSATSGYFNNPDATSKLFHGTWLDTGDLGYLADGELYITGRRKDIIIRAGRNIYPEDLERTVAAIDGVRKGRVVVFGTPHPRTGTERLVVLAETRESDTVTRQELSTAINHAVTELLGSPPDDVVLAPPGSVLKTSSGKIRRAACRAAYEEGTLGQPTTAAWQQLVRVYLPALPSAPGRLWRGLRRLLYSAWANIALVLTQLLMLPLLLLTPSLRGRWKLARRSARFLLAAAGLTPRVIGAERLYTATSPCVVVVNHRSYLDALVVMAVIPWPVRFVAAREVAGGGLSGLVYRRMGTLFVERSDFRESVADAEAVSSSLQIANSLVFFPEGRMSAAPSLQRFRMGAFLAAARVGCPIQPVVLRGTREVLRGDSRWLRHGRIEAEVLAPIDPEPAEDEWHVATRLRERAEAAMAAALGRIES